MSIRIKHLEGERTGAVEDHDGRGVEIGSDPGCDVQFQESDLVSPRHCAIRPDSGEGSYRLEDLGSRNGTYLNHMKLRGPRELSEGDVISLGMSGPRLQLLELAPGRPTGRDRAPAAERRRVAAAPARRAAPEPRAPRPNPLKTPQAKIGLGILMAILVLGGGIAIARMAIRHRPTPPPEVAKPSPPPTTPRFEPTVAFEPAPELPPPEPEPPEAPPDGRPELPGMIRRARTAVHRIESYVKVRSPVLHMKRTHARAFAIGDGFTIVVPASVIEPWKSRPGWKNLVAKGERMGAVTEMETVLVPTGAPVFLRGQTDGEGFPLLNDSAVIARVGQGLNELGRAGSVVILESRQALPALPVTEPREGLVLQIAGAGAKTYGLAGPPAGPVLQLDPAPSKASKSWLGAPVLSGFGLVGVVSNLSASGTPEIASSTSLARYAR